MFRCQNFISRCSHQCHVLACAGTQPDQTLYPDGAVCLTTSQSAVRVLLALQSSNCAESGCLRRTGRRTCQLQGLEAKGGTQSFLTHSSHLRAHISALLQHLGPAHCIIIRFGIIYMQPFLFPILDVGLWPSCTMSVRPSIMTVPNACRRMTSLQVSVQTAKRRITSAVSACPTPNLREPTWRRLTGPDGNGYGYGSLSTTQQYVCTLPIQLTFEYFFPRE